MTNDSTGNECYSIRGYGDDFETGTTSEGQQVLMGLLCPYIVAYFFSSDGALVGGERREWNRPAPRVGTDGPYQIYDRVFRESLSEQILGWQSELGFTPGVIRVRPFFDDEHCVGIEAFPEHLEDLNESDDGYELLCAERQQWVEEGNFVFRWAKDYYMTRGGEVAST
ncbi:MAG TPA: hypothetical protein VN256_11990 [Pyrinomonadaceae bacterium]|nr:hypothetical protein [Pyrinomonadaceae bacterium]